MKHFVVTVGLCCNLTLAVADSDQPYVSNSAIFNIENSSLYNKNNQLEIPSLGTGSSQVDRIRDRLIGEKVYRQLHQHFPLISDPWLDNELMSTFTNILNQTDLGQTIALVVVNDPQINAFAVPGGLFAINSGLVFSSHNMDEVASVMAHEVAHVSQRHFIRSDEQFKGQALLAMAGILIGTALVTMMQNTELGSMVLFGSQAAAANSQLSYSRNQEREADRIGMQYLVAAKYNPEAMPDFFETMNKTSVKVSFFPDFWLTHPKTSQRMSEARLRANQFPKIPYLQNKQNNFEIIKWYLAVLSNQANDEQVFAIAGQNKIEGLIALAKLQLLRGDYSHAQTQLNLAKKINSEHALVTLIQTDIYLGQNKVEDAYQTISAKQRITPENRALSYKLAEVYIRQNNAKQAEQLVNRFIKINDRDISGWQLLQQAANLDKENPMRTVNVLRNRAEVQYWSGDEENAIKSLLHAQRLAKDNNAMTARIDKRLKVMQEEYGLKI